jgi:crotonobetainyl-CoA:carnitine CoA-transferase CaiB-like acyl-CoA transferase
MHTTPSAALEELLRAAGLAEKHGDSVDFDGSDPVFPTPYRIGTAGAGAIAAVGVASARLWALRSGRSQRIGVDVRQAAASLRGHKYVLVNGANPHSRDPITRFYQCGDGRWIYLHNNFPQLRERNLRVAGAAHEVPAIERAVAQWKGAELEEAIFGAGGCCGLVRSDDEWLAHPQGATVAAQPVLEIYRIGDAPPQPLPAGDRPLAGIRALDLTRVIAGPYCARVLAEHGAQVMKIARRDLPNSGPLDIETGAGKLSAFLDLREPAGAERMRALVREGDIFVNAYRPGALAAHGFGPEALAALRPGIVYVTLSAWGHQGPWAARRGFDTVVQAVNGMAARSAVDGRPAQLPVAAIDYISGNVMAFGAMVALARRATEGGSWAVRVSLAAIGHWIGSGGLVDPAVFGRAPAELPQAALDGLLRRVEASMGTVHYVPWVGRMAETPSGTLLPPLPLGSSEPRWP